MRNILFSPSSRFFIFKPKGQKGQKGQNGQKGQCLLPLQHFSDVLSVLEVEYDPFVSEDRDPVDSRIPQFFIK